MIRTRDLAWSAVGFVALACSATGCGSGQDVTFGADDAASADGSGDSTAPGTGDAGGGDDGATDIDATPGDDSGTDAGKNDAGRDGATLDAGPDTGVGGSCAPAGSACGSKGSLCKSGTCQACVDPTDDGACSAAYPGAPQICKAGSCTPGTCHSSAGCTGQLCTPTNVCAACTTDAQCKADPTFGASTICTTASAGLGTCVSSACANLNAPCAANATDICCATSLAAACVGGNCCADAQCSGATPVCRTNTCTACDAVGAPYQYHVDPVNGSDATGSTGSGTSGASAAGTCKFKTVTRALQVLLAASSNSPNPGTQVLVDVAGPLGAGETFAPNFGIVVPSNVTIVGGVAGVVVAPPSNAAAFTLATMGAGLQNLKLDGRGASATGVLAGSGAGATLTTISNVEITGFTANGVRAASTAALTITGGSYLHGNGGDGLAVGDTAVVTITGGTVANPTQFSSNTARGIQVGGRGSVRITGTVTNGQGTVVTRGNTLAGVFVSQQVQPVNPANGTCGANCTAPPQNVINGLVARENGTHGLHLVGGSNVQLRNSYSSANLANGVLVSSAAGFANTNDGNDFSRIDLGTAGSFGRNTFNDASALNAFQGICFDAQSGNPTPLLSAAGNLFGLPGGGQLDCTAAGSSIQPNPASICDASGLQRAISLSQTGSGNRLTAWNVMLCNVIP